MNPKTFCAMCSTEIAAPGGSCPQCGWKPEVRGLHRGHPDKLLSGVCAGLSQQFGVDATIIRIFFAISALVSFGTAAWAYVLLWVLMPEQAGGTSPAARVMRNVKSVFTSDGLPRRENV